MLVKHFINDNYKIRIIKPFEGKTFTIEIVAYSDNGHIYCISDGKFGETDDEIEDDPAEDEGGGREVKETSGHFSGTAGNTRTTPPQLCRSISWTACEAAKLPSSVNGR